METFTKNWCLLVILGFLLSVKGQVPMDELTDLQDKALNLVMEDFHTKEYVRYRFQVLSILEAMEEKYSAGIFVRLHYTKKQTNCPKSQWKGKDCKSLNNGKVFNCFACYKFAYGNHEVLSKLNDCVNERFVNEGRQRKRLTECRTVEKRKEIGLGLPGSFSFLQSSQ
ncbi:hypothetical protein GDO86_011993 [Hymenochirus boettgeri]|uniref:Retinoic acid receptor responder protein 2 n=1 Tax=Hymenochirus boettgeri TaxID=247094 RepID=A0A8T2JIP9_9PIPI|nr:hypothetical protein GDO86_011993 [Hymenochirus boettgeri]